MSKRKVSHRRLKSSPPRDRHGGHRPFDESGRLSEVIRMLAREAARQTARQLRDWFQA
jgi:hypothetical protein